MAKKMIKVLLFTYGKEVLAPHGTQEGETTVVEGLARLGEVVDITRPYDIERGERADAFYTDKERKAIEAGTYTGEDAPTLYASRLQEAQQVIQPVEGEGQADISNMSAEEVAAVIKNEGGKPLNIPETVDLAGDDLDSINKVLDAEHIASENEPRVGVIKALEARAAEATP